MPQINLSPYPYAAEQQAIDRRRQMAILLQQQAMQPVEAPPVPGASISPVQGIAKIVQALVGSYQNSKLDQQQRGLEQRIMGDRGDRSQDFAKLLVGDAQPTKGPLPAGTLPAELGASQLDLGNGQSEPAPGTPELSQPVTLPPTAQAQQNVFNTREQLAKLIASPHPDQQKLAEVIIGKFLSNDERDKQMANALLLEQYKQSGRPIPEGAALPDGRGGFTIPSPKTPTLRPIAPGSFIQDPNTPGGFTQIGQPRIDPNAPAQLDRKLADAQTLKASPGTPVQPQAPMSPERFTQEQQLVAERAAAAQKRAEDASARQQVIQQSRAPDSVKVGIDKAFQAKDMIQNVRDAVKAKPYLLGPVAGRLEQTAQGIGTSFGLQNPQDEQDAATLAGNIGNLLITELQLASPGRTSVQLLPEIKKFSAQIKDNPNMLEGFLKGTENRANVVVNGGKRWGIDLTKPPTAAGPPTGGASGMILVLLNGLEGEIPEAQWPAFSAANPTATRR